MKTLFWKLFLTLSSFVRIWKRKGIHKRKHYYFKNAISFKSFYGGINISNPLVSKYEEILSEISPWTTKRQHEKIKRLAFYEISPLQIACFNLLKEFKCQFELSFHKHVQLQSILIAYIEQYSPINFHFSPQISKWCASQNAPIWILKNPQSCSNGAWHPFLINPTWEFAKHI